MADSNDVLLPPTSAIISSVDGFLGDKETYLTEFDFRRILDNLLPPEIIGFINQNYEFVFKKEVADKEGAFLPPGCKGNEGSSKARVEIYKKSFFDQNNKFNITKFYFVISHLIAHGIDEPKDIPLGQVMPFLLNHSKEAPSSQKQKEIWADFVALSFLNAPLAKNLSIEVHQKYIWSLDHLPQKIASGQETIIEENLNPQFEDNIKTSIPKPSINDLFAPYLKECSYSILSRLKAQGIL